MRRSTTRARSPAVAVKSPATVQEEAEDVAPQPPPRLTAKARRQVMDSDEDDEVLSQTPMSRGAAGENASGVSYTLEEILSQRSQKAASSSSSVRGAAAPAEEGRGVCRKRARVEEEDHEGQEDTIGITEICEGLEKLVRSRSAAVSITPSPPADGPCPPDVCVAISFEQARQAGQGTPAAVEKLLKSMGCTSGAEELVGSGFLQMVAPGLCDQDTREWLLAVMSSDGEQRVAAAALQALIAMSPAGSLLGSAVARLPRRSTQSEIVCPRNVVYLLSLISSLLRSPLEAAWFPDLARLAESLAWIIVATRFHRCRKGECDNDETCPVLSVARAARECMCATSAASCHRDGEAVATAQWTKELLGDDSRTGNVAFELIASLPGVTPFLSGLKCSCSWTLLRRCLLGNADMQEDPTIERLCSLIRKSSHKMTAPDVRLVVGCVCCCVVNSPTQDWRQHHQAELKLCLEKLHRRPEITEAKNDLVILMTLLAHLSPAPHHSPEPRQRILDPFLTKTSSAAPDKDTEIF